MDTGEKKIWAAAPAFECAVGDIVSVPPGMPMADFKSKTLNREFKMIYFVGAIRRAGETESAIKPQEMPKDHPPIGAQAEEHPMIPPQMVSIPESSKIEIGTIEKAEGGKTVSEIISNRKNLAGKQVRVRAKAVKFTPNIMGKNWLHIQDGSGDKGSNDLIVTTEATAEIGDVVLISGMVSVDRDFGFGLMYPVIIEDADVAIEKEIK